MITRPYRFGLVVPLVLIPVFTFAAMSAFQWLKHLILPNNDHLGPTSKPLFS